jgi:hypothetical protein
MLYLIGWELQGLDSILKHCGIVTKTLCCKRYLLDHVLRFSYYIYNFLILYIQLFSPTDLITYCTLLVWNFENLVAF